MSLSYQSLNNNRLLIFDFDGVLADSFNCFYPMNKDAMASIGILLSEEEYRNLFLENIHQSFKDLISNNEKYIKYSEYRKNHYLDYYKPKIFPDTKNFLETIKNKFKLTIASSGKREVVLNTLSINKVQDFFDFILATNEYSKENMIQEILDHFKTNSKEATMITDTVGDIKIAKKIGVKTIAVTWGFHSINLLQQANPDVIVRDFKELASVLNYGDN